MMRENQSKKLQRFIGSLKNWHIYRWNASGFALKINGYGLNVLKDYFFDPRLQNDY
jgi:hypothetical protein